MRRFVPCTNAAPSARVYTIPPRELLRAERAAEDDGLEMIGVVHSHTHTEPYPSPTDVAQAPDPDWHYVIVSLKREAPETRSYRIVDGDDRRGARRRRLTAGSAPLRFPTGSIGWVGFRASLRAERVDGPVQRTCST